jgi:hypothetical protein
MPTFVNPYDVTAPPDTETERDGALNIRTHKSAWLERVQVEHDWPTASGAGSGRHKFPIGNTAARPADNPAAPGGNIFLNTQEGNFDYWNGAVWTPLYVSNSGTAVKVLSASPNLTLTTTPQDIPGTVATSATVLNPIIIPFVDYTTNSGQLGDSQLQVFLVVGTVTFGPVIAAAPELGQTALQSCLPYVAGVLPIGTTIKLQALVTTNSGGVTGVINRAGYVVYPLNP